MAVADVLALQPATGGAVLVGTTVLLAIWLLQQSTKRPSKMPPGPRPWPLIGNFNLLYNNPNATKTFQDLRREFGNIFTLYFGPRAAVVISGHDLIKEALIDRAQHFSERPRGLHFVEVFSENLGIITNTNDWEKTRRFGLRTLKAFGLGKTSLEDRIIDEAHVLCKAIENFEDKPFSIHRIYNQATSNIICSVVFGKRFDYSDVSFQNINDDITQLVLKAGIGRPDNHMPWLRFLPPFRAAYDELKNLSDTFKDYILAHVAEHRETFDPDNIRDFIDLYLEAERNMEDAGVLHERQMLFIIRDLFIAGTETTSTTMKWATLYLITHPEIQDKCRKEIMQVIGANRAPTLADKKQMPYMEAFLLEVQRIGTILPISLPHTVIEDVELQGYTLAKNTVVIPNLFSAHMDTEVWGDPQVFRPERWLDENNKIIRHEAFMPFSTGRRVCLGEQLARRELLIFLTTLIQKFEFKMADETNPPSHDAVLGVARGPKYFEIRVAKV